jgi:hypothetical protein
MKKTQVYLGIILALVLLYSCPLFAGDKSFGVQGMSSAGEIRTTGFKGMSSADEMKTSSKSGGAFTSQSNIANVGTQVRYGGDEKSRSTPMTNANTITQLNTKGYSSSPRGTVILSDTTSSAAQSAVVAASGAKGTPHGYAEPFLPGTSAEAQSNTSGNVASSSSDALTLFRQNPSVQTGSTQDTVVISRNRSLNRVITHGGGKKRPSVDDPLDLSQ